jgi:hypothetical protein
VHPPLFSCGYILMPLQPPERAVTTVTYRPPTITFLGLVMSCPSGPVKAHACFARAEVVCSPSQPDRTCGPQWNRGARFCVMRSTAFA